MPRQTQMNSYSNARRLLEKQPRVRTFQTRNSCSSNSWSTVRDSCKKKWIGLKIGAENWLDCWIVVKKWMSCWKLLTVENKSRDRKKVLKQLLKQMRVVLSCSRLQSLWSDTPWAKAQRIFIKRVHIASDGLCVANQQAKPTKQSKQAKQSQEIQERKQSMQSN